MATEKKLRIALISLHGLIRGENLELGRDEDTGGQTRYILELARALAKNPEVGEVNLITRQIIDERVSKDYAQLKEKIGDNAYIIRIPFGPKRYLSKAKLWPYMEVFVDQCLHYFRRTNSVPDIIHGHYADAGYGGAQLARLTGIPFIFTGHSLGRVKKQRLLESGVDESKIESKYAIATRIEAEEYALETCSLIVTSTRQEVREQYELYEHYIPERMYVIPPGVDLEKFHTHHGEDKTELEQSIDSFFHDPKKPMIAAMARPDERKNLEMLVKVYGESPKLQREANLVLIMGSREDLRDMPSGQKSVLTNILTLIDVYDLYGKVAYPKNHKSEDVPALYRAVTQSRGVFVNPAMTEPFGLTLLEAAASGAPIVATNDGGPSDIIANCKNGLLVDPFDPKAIEKALLRVLTEEDSWDQWSKAGLENVYKFYSWDHHTKNYVRDIKEVIRGFSISPAIDPKGRKSRNLPQVDRLVIADIDNTITGDEESMRSFFDMINNTSENIGFGIATGRRYEEVIELMGEYDIPQPEVLITSVGTEIYYGKNFTLDSSWSKHINYKWEPEKVIEVLNQIEGLHYQDEENQSKFKVSYEVDFKVAPSFQKIKRILRENGLKVKVICSLGMFLDILPTRADSGLCIRHLAFKWGFPLEHILVAGDSGNDEAMLAGNTLGVVVGNYSPELKKLQKYPRVYFSKAHHAAGIIEGIEYYNFLDKIEIPNEK